MMVTGATGNVGSVVVRELAARGLPARAFVRDPAKAAALLGPATELAVGDFADPVSVRAALDGVDAVFLACGNVGDQVAYETTVIDAATRAGVRRLVKLSALGAEAGSPVVMWDWHARIERHLSASGVPVVVLRPRFYMTNLLALAATVGSAGALFLPAEGVKVPMIDPAASPATWPPSSPATWPGSPPDPARRPSLCAPAAPGGLGTGPGQRMALAPGARPAAVVAGPRAGRQGPARSLVPLRLGDLPMDRRPAVRGRAGRRPGPGGQGPGRVRVRAAPGRSPRRGASRRSQAAPAARRRHP